MNKRMKADLCIIGGGSGGLSVAAGAAQMGARVVLVEGGQMGGDCLNHGCVPSKALIAAARHAYLMTSGQPFGIAPVEPEIDFAAVKAHVASVIEGIAPNDSVERFRGLGVEVIEDYGRFVSATELQAGNALISARRFVIASGSSPFVPPIPGLEKVPYDTNETIFANTDKPDHLIIIGGGPIGMELAQTHRRLKCKVTVLEGMLALGKDDPELTAIALARIRSEGVNIVEGAMAERISGRKGAIAVHTKDGTTWRGSHLLIAVGRKPNIERLDLDAAGVEHHRTGIKVDAGLKTSNRRIYAIGDVAGGLQFTHVAGYQAGIVIRSALFGLPSKATTAHIPWATYTDPELAQVGLTEAEGRKIHGERLEVVRFDYAENDRARMERKTEGLVKLMLVKGRLVGASIVGAQAGELIALWSLAIASKLKVGAVAGMVTPYPTLFELNKRAAGAYFSPRLFHNPWVKRLVRLVQKF